MLEPGVAAAGLPWLAMNFPGVCDAMLDKLESDDIDDDCGERSPGLARHGDSGGPARPGHRGRRDLGSAMGQHGGDAGANTASSANQIRWVGTGPY